MEEKYIQMLVEASQSAKSAHHRLDKIETDIGEIKELTIAVKEIAMETKATREDVNDMNSRLKDVENKPAKKWEDIEKIIITRNSNSYFGLFFSKIWFIERWIFMNFGKAIQLLKEGKKLQRKGWNGKNQYIELAERISYMNAKGEIINKGHSDIGNKVIAFVGTSGVQLGWLASQSDMLAEDWKVVEEE